MKHRTLDNERSHRADATPIQAASPMATATPSPLAPMDTARWSRTLLAACRAFAEGRVLPALMPRLRATRSSRLAGFSSPAPGEPSHAERPLFTASAAARLAATAVRRGRLGLAALCLALLSFAASAEAQTEVPDDWGLIPSGLGPGDSFRLLFITSTKDTATATAIAAYNTFVQDRAAAGHTDIQAYRSNFKVVGSTASVDARDNTATHLHQLQQGCPPSTGSKAPRWPTTTRTSTTGAGTTKRTPGSRAEMRQASTSPPAVTSRSRARSTTGTEALFSGQSRALGASQVRVGKPNVSGGNAGPLR